MIADTLKCDSPNIETKISYGDGWKYWERGIFITTAQLVEQCGNLYFSV